MRILRLLLAAGVTAGALSACGSQSDSVAGFVADKQPPVVRFDTTVTNTPGDSAISFSLLVSDNLDIARIHVDVTGGVQMSSDTTPAVSTTRITIAMRVPVPASVAPGTPIYVVAHVRDGAGNESTSDTLHLSAGTVRPPAVTLVPPVSARPVSAFHIVGKPGALAVVTVRSWPPSHNQSGQPARSRIRS